MSAPGSEIKFGTDGWRAVISDTFTFKNVRIVSQAIAEWVNNNLAKESRSPKLLALGYDTRFLSEEYAQTVACVLAANGIQVLLSDSPIPTPALSFGITRQQALAGVMITASHNPGRFNGIKIKTAKGGAAGKDVTDILESYLGRTEIKSVTFAEGEQNQSIVRHDYKPDYIQFLRSYVDMKKLKTASFKVLTDVMHGSGDSLMLQILKGTKIKLSLMRQDINPYFDGTKPEPVAEYVPELRRRVKQEKFHVGLILDGDADRIGAVGANGQFISPQKILCLLILHLVRNRGQKGGIVKTICGSTMIDKITQKLGLKLYETPVGFKYISDLMSTQDILTGGEEAGGIGFKNYIPERDGSLAGILLLEMMAFRKKGIDDLLQEMEKEFGRYYYARADLSLGNKPLDRQRIKAVSTILGKKVVEVKDYDGIKFICEDESWLMFRPSGTEPLVRIYSEASSVKKAQELLKFGESLAV